MALSTLGVRIQETVSIFSMPQEHAEQNDRAAFLPITLRIASLRSYAYVLFEHLLSTKTTCFTSSFLKIASEITFGLKLAFDLRPFQDL